jgi:hypothetical protein
MGLNRLLELLIMALIRWITAKVGLIRHLYSVQLFLKMSSKLSPTLNMAL